jgi:hypothetical protein
MSAPMQGPQQTNDLGEFRVAGLVPGEYFIAAVPRRFSGFGVPGIATRSSSTEAACTMDRPEAAGSFSVDDLLPGVYMIVAVDDVDAIEWLNADYLDRLRPLATRIEVAAGEGQTIVLERVNQQ